MNSIDPWPSSWSWTQPQTERERKHTCVHLSSTDRLKLMCGNTTRLPAWHTFWNAGNLSGTLQKRKWKPMTKCFCSIKSSSCVWWKLNPVHNKTTSVWFSETPIKWINDWGHPVKVRLLLSCQERHLQHLQHVFLLLIVLTNSSFEQLKPSVKIDHQMFMKRIIMESFYGATPERDSSWLTFTCTTHVWLTRNKRNDGRDPVSNDESHPELESFKLCRKIQLIPH